MSAVNTIREKIKYMAYRAPLPGVMTPTYKYKINPGQLHALIGFIDATKVNGGAVVEIGVAQGDTSSFLLEHLKTTDDPRDLLLFDTFSGFTESSIDVEVNLRGKEEDAYMAFRYGDEQVFSRKLKAAGYSRFRTFSGDASEFDWGSIGPIGCVLLDIDVYEPTAKILRAVYPHLCEGGGIVVDDCLSNTPWDGSLQAYEEFISEFELPFRRVGEKGAVVLTPLADGGVAS